MKKTFVVAVLSVLFVFVVSSAFAAPRKSSNSGRAHKNVGCGLGTLLWQNNADDSILSQSLQATTNGTSGNQTFGITTGTSDCDQPSNFAKNDRLNEFVVANMDNLAKDIAKGNGETLATFAELMQIPTEKRAEFYQNLQTNFAKVFSSEQVVLASVVDNAAAVAPKN
jgi:hypothetical protein